MARAKAKTPVLEQIDSGVWQVRDGTCKHTYAGIGAKKEATAHLNDLIAEKTLPPLNKKLVNRLSDEVDDLFYLVSEGIEKAAQRRHLKTIRDILKKI